MDKLITIKRGDSFGYIRPVMTEVYTRSKGYHWQERLRVVSNTGQIIYSDYWKLRQLGDVIKFLQSEGWSVSND